MLDKITQITVGEKKYPMAFTLNVMEVIQEKYGSLDTWSDALQPDKVEDAEGILVETEPKLKDLIWTFQQFLNEGIEIENEEKSEKRELLTHKQVGRIITTVGLSESGSLIRALTMSESSGDEKNTTATQTLNQ